jgi:hypothetical protein
LDISYTLLLWRYRMHLPPPSGALLHIGIVAGGVIAIIPVWLWRGRLDVHLGRWLDIDWRRRDDERRIHIWHPEGDYNPWDDHHRRPSIAIITMRAMTISPLPSIHRHRIAPG